MKLTDSWNISLGTIREVPIQVHSSFLLLIGWVFLSGDASTASRLTDVAFLISVFFCILLHECGHVFVGQSYGVRTRDITLYPFGGVATLLSQPTPRQEFFIALAGPIVSFLIAGGILFLARDEDFFLIELARTNLVLAVFNLIPAIPMDGGRILRALLAILHVRAATTIAARVSQVCSVLLFIAGLYIGSPVIVFISVFVFFGAIQELIYSKTKKAVSSRIAQDLMIEKEKLYCFQHGTTLTDAIQIALRSLQEYFPVLHNDELLGIVSRQVLIETISVSSDEQYIAGLADRSVQTVAPTTPLDEVVRISEEKNIDLVAVKDEGRFLGLIFIQNISDVMLVDTFKNSHSEPETYIDVDREPM